MKQILITGRDSYIGTSFNKWICQPLRAEMYKADTVDMRGEEWKQKDFSGYDTVFHVAGIAHADIGRVTKEQKELYYQVNCTLAVETAKKARREGVKQFIYMSSIIIYGEGGSVSRKKVITRDTKPEPSSFYGNSKWMAEQMLVTLQTDGFKVAILRPPMIYGDGCKGNYRTLLRLARITPVFPEFCNERSVLSMQNLCQFLGKVIESGTGGVYFPQDSEYKSTSDLLREIASKNGKRIWFTPAFNRMILLMGKMPGKPGKIINKAFGTLIIENKIGLEEFHE